MLVNDKLVGLYFLWLLIVGIMAVVIVVVVSLKRRPVAQQEPTLPATQPMVVPEKDKVKLLSQSRSHAKAESQRMRRQIADRGTPATDEETAKLRRLGDLSRRMSVKIKKLNAEQRAGESAESSGTKE